MSQYKTSAAKIETETSTAELAQEVHERAEQTQVAAAETALLAKTSPYPAGVVPAGEVTAAANVELHAKNPADAQKIHKLAEHTAGVAQHAASIAHTKGPGVTGEPSDVFTQLGANASATTDAAVAEGKKNVQAASAAGSGYLEQAKNLASSAFSTAQSYIPGGIGANPNQTTSTQKPNSSTLPTAASAIDTAKQYAASAQAAAQPQVDAARSTIQSGLQSGANYAVETAQGLMGYGATGAESKPSGIPATSAALESGKHTVSTPYPPTGSSQGPDAQRIAELPESTSAGKSGISATSAPLESGPHTVGTPYLSTTTKKGSGGPAVAANQK